MHRRKRAPGLGRVAALTAVAASALAITLTLRSCSGRRPASGDGAEGVAHGRAPYEAPRPSAANAWTDDDPSLARLGAPGAPESGWEGEAEEVAADLRRMLDGHPAAGAYAEARAEAARADLALFPPARARVYRLLLGSEGERTLALAALAARPDLDDDLLRTVLRAHRPGDDEVVRLLGAEIAAGVAPELAARHEEDLLRAFEGEPNPLVLAVALPALERMAEPRLRRLLRSQVAVASPEMLAVLLTLARERLAPPAVEDLEDALSAAVRAAD